MLVIARSSTASYRNQAIDPGQIDLAAIYGELGNTKECEALIRVITRLAPNFSIQSYVQGLSFSDPKVLDRMEQGLRKAGLPDQVFGYLHC